MKKNDIKNKIGKLIEIYTEQINDLEKEIKDYEKYIKEYYNRIEYHFKCQKLNDLILFRLRLKILLMEI